MFPIPHLRLTGATLAALFAGVRILLAQDAAAVNSKQMLQALQQLKDQQSTQEKSFKQKAFQEAMAAAGNPAKANELWQEAVRLTQFAGAARESTQFREWRDKEGEALKQPEVQTALHLYFSWLAITLQRSTGANVHDLLPAILTHVREARAAEMALDALDDAIKKEKEAAAPVPTSFGTVRKIVPAAQKERRQADDSTRRMADQIANRPLGGSTYVEAMHLTEYLTTLSPARRPGGRGQQQADQNIDWEPTPGNADGIYERVVLPQMRLDKDARAIEYWDGKMQREADQATRTKLSFEIDKFNTVRRPQLMWGRAQEYANIGQKNRAATEMFSVIKANPNHADAGTWITQLQSLLAPPADAAPAAPAAAPPAN